MNPLIAWLLSRWPRRPRVIASAEVRICTLRRRGGDRMRLRFYRDGRLIRQSLHAMDLTLGETNALCDQWWAETEALAG